MRLLRGLACVTVLALAVFFCLVPSASAATPKQANLSISLKSHGYGTVAVGTSSASQAFAITNVGQSVSGPLTTTVTGPNAADFVVDANSCTATLAAGATCSVSLHFAPTAEGARTTSLSVGATPGGTVSASLKGTGATAKLKLSPSSHLYGSVTIGTSSGAQSYTVTNTGAGPSGPVAVAITGANAGEFVQDSSTCGAAIAAGSSCTVSIHFTPAAAGARDATLTATASPGGSDSAALHGTGAAKALLAVSPSTFDYGHVVVGTSSAVKTFTVTNTGQSTSGVLTVGIGGTDSPSFPRDATTCGAKLAVGASCTVSVHLAPTATGPLSATLSVTATPGGTATAALQGTGATPAALSIDPTTFDYGTVATGSTSDEHTFTVTNTGQGASGPMSVTVSGANQTDFPVDATTCGTALPGQGTCTVSVRYSPMATGPGTATLSVTASPGGTATAALQGIGATPAVLSISPTSFDYGPALVGTTSPDQTFTVTNTGQGASGPISVATNGTNAADFVVAGTTCGVALPGGGSCTVAVHFTPGSAGDGTANLSATATPGGTATATLAGAGLAPATLSIDPTSADLGQTPIGVTSAAFTFTVTNTGQAESGTVAVALSGANASSFAQSSTCGPALAPGASCTVTVTFRSFSANTYTADLTATATPGGTATSSLRAQAIVPAFFQLSTPSDFGPVLLGASTPSQTLTLTNLGQQTSGQVNVVLSGANTSDFVVETNTCTTLVGGASCTVTVHFTPSALGGRSATITFSANPGVIRSATLQGTGVTALQVSPASFTFPDQFVGTTSAPTDFVVTNYGTAPLSSFTITASDLAEFPITQDTCLGVTLNTGASCTVSVAFNAANLGLHSSTMNISLVDPGQIPHNASFQVSGTSIVPPPDLSTTMAVTSQSSSSATITITVRNLGSAQSAPATMTIDVLPTQSFSYSAGAGTDCTARFINGFQSEFTCPVPVIAVGDTYTRQLSVSNLSGQGPRLIQTNATTLMPGDTNSSNNRGFASVTLNG